MTTRRQTLAGLSLCALAPHALCAQPGGIARLGWLSLDRSEGSVFLEPFLAGMQDFGYVEGRNLRLEARWGEGSLERLSGLALELVRAKPDVIVAQGGTALGPITKAGATVPVVFAYSGDSVMAGFVESLGRPGRHSTGISFLALELVGKRIELLKEMIPSIARIAVLANPEHPGDEAELRASQQAASALGLVLEYFSIRSRAILDDALAAIARSRNQAVVVFPDALTVRHRRPIAELGLKHRLPIVSGWDRFAESGCLMSYGPNQRASYRRLGFYVDRILRGTRAAELPVELPQVVELVVNVRTAQALGVEVPRSVLVRADRVIE